MSNHLSGTSRNLRVEPDICRYSVFAMTVLVWHPFCVWPLLQYPFLISAMSPAGRPGTRLGDEGHSFVACAVFVFVLEANMRAGAESEK